MPYTIANSTLCIILCFPVDWVDLVRECELSLARQACILHHMHHITVQTLQQLIYACIGIQYLSIRGTFIYIIICNIGGSDVSVFISCCTPPSKIGLVSVICKHVVVKLYRRQSTGMISVNVYVVQICFSEVGDWSKAIEASQRLTEPLQ